VAQDSEDRQGTVNDSGVVSDEITTAREPFYLDSAGVWLLPITHEQADDLFRDAKLWFFSVNKWFVDDPPSYYDRVGMKPSGYNVDTYAIEVSSDSCDLGAPDE